MNKYLTFLASTMLLFAGLSLITGCSSSGDDGGGGTVPVPTTVPANAVEITAANAETTVATSVAASGTFEAGLMTALSIETTPVIGLNGVLDLVLPLIRDRLNNSGIDPVTAAEYNESGDCFVSGTWSGSGNEIIGDTSYSDTFNAAFNDCDDGLGFIIDGTLAGTVTENYDIYAYTVDITGDLSVISTYDSTVEFSYSGINYQESGDYSIGTYNKTHMDYAIDFIVNGTSSGGFLSKVTTAVVESDGYGMPCPESGHITITGANSTTAEGIYNGDTTMTIKANGETVNASAMCYY